MSKTLTAREAREMTVEKCKEIYGDTIGIIDNTISQAIQACRMKCCVSLAFSVFMFNIISYYEALGYKVEAERNQSGKTYTLTLEW